LSKEDGAPRPRPRLTAAQRRELIEQAATEVFAERGYRGASIDEIARRSGVTPPVVYDHFASKLDLHRRLLERTRDELLVIWRGQLAGDAPPAQRVARALDAWARYVEEHRFAARMFFQAGSGDPEVRETHRAVQGQARRALAGILGGEAGGERLAGGADAESLEMAAETIRAGLAGLAIWWDDHPDVPRERIVATALGVLWTGFERARAQPADAAATTAPAIAARSSSETT
jgi:AcrR family transcriptional regulator